MRDSGRTAADDREAVERDLDLAWELFGAQPTHPRIAELALRVLAAQPERSTPLLLLASHREFCGDVEEARRLFLQVAGRRDGQFINAARGLRRVASGEHEHAEALRWARTVLGEEHENWDDWMELGAAQARAGEHEKGWHQLDEAVALCARTEPDDLPKALRRRARYLLESLAPPERFAPAAEAAVRADATDPGIAMLLGWAYLAQYRYDDAEELGLRLLREDPTDDLLQSLVRTARTMQGIVEKARGQDISLADIQGTGAIEMAWQQLRDQRLGIDLPSALAALDAVLPAGLRDTLRPGASPADLAGNKVGSMVAKNLVSWHDGQQPGSGAVWELAEPFRLMSAAEILAMDAEIEADQAAHPDWPANEMWEQVMTDDAGSYLVAVAFGALVKRRPGQPDEPVAASVADWVWDRVAGFGGLDPRPTPRKAADLPAGLPADDLPSIPGTSLSGVIATMYAALGAPEDAAAYAELRGLFPGLSVRRSEFEPVILRPDGVNVALLDGLVERVTVDLAICQDAGRVISGLDLTGVRPTVDAYLQAHGALPHNSWVNRASGAVFVTFDLADHRLGVQWEDGKLAQIYVSAAD
ncbi:tetratricopeptide repeat protein [Hamadaea sp. NPDC051192]|uniref:tetratricopeptide repeat protein n=1 Tax=Hamadaea sp. NPDC051192 TaxID=3154940 RepID=UPI00342F5EE9